MLPDVDSPPPPRILLLHIVVTAFTLGYLFVFFWTTVPQFRPASADAEILESPYWQMVERQVSSTESKNTENILKFFAWTSILVFVAFLGVFGLVMVAQGSETALGEFRAQRMAITLAIGVGLFQLWYFARAILGVMSIYRDKHRFQKALFRAVSGKLDLWQHLALFKLAILRLGTTLIPIVGLLGLLSFLASLSPNF